MHEDAKHGVIFTIEQDGEEYGILIDDNAMAFLKINGDYVRVLRIEDAARLGAHKMGEMEEIFNNENARQQGVDSE